MSSWPRGEAEVEELLRRRELERITGTAADGSPLLAQAGRTATTAASLVKTDPYSAYVLAYDAARFACVALLAQEGLRATSSGGHYAVERVVRAQFGSGFRPFGDLRRRRNELEYPHHPADRATGDEAKQAIAVAQQLIGAAQALIDQLPLFD
jgi:hypothetical protein